jgi:hypothetical protein
MIARSSFLGVALGVTMRMKGSRPCTITLEKPRRRRGVGSMFMNAICSWLVSFTCSIALDSLVFSWGVCTVAGVGGGRGRQGDGCFFSF